MLVLQNAPRPPLRLPGLAMAAEEIATGTAKFDLSLNLAEARPDGAGAGAGMEGTLEYRTDLFEGATARRLAVHLNQLLRGIARDPGQRLLDLPLLTAAEREQILGQWAASPAPWPREACVHEIFEEQVRLRPHAVAVELGEESLTYAELNGWANRVAHRLRRLGVGPEVRVGLCTERSLPLVAGMLGILKAGGAYVPLDPTYPEERLAFLLADAGVGIVATRRDLAETVPLGDVRTVLLDQDLAGESDTGPELDPEPLVTPENLAYVMYTSGSTGVPKGVEIVHRGIVRLVRSEPTGHARLGRDETVLHIAPPSFDASTAEIWGALLHGGRLVIFPGHTPSLEEIGEVIARHGVTIAWLTAGLFHQMVDNRLQDLRPLRAVLPGGDVVSRTHVRRVLEELPGCVVCHCYGPTENTSFTTAHELARAEDLGDKLPIGRPVANTRVYLLDPELRPVPAGVPGELYTGGDGLARGYLSRPELTAERFLPDPFGDGERLYRTGDMARWLQPQDAVQDGGMTGDRLYRTGDRARWQPDGTIEFLGRGDQQVKIRGFRVEPGEVEAELSLHPAVAAVAVLPRDLPGGKVLVAFLVPARQEEPQEEAPEDAAETLATELRSWLRSRLPEPFIPSFFVELAEMPLTANAKVDRRELARIDVLARGAREHVAPRTPTEVGLAALWAGVLGRREIGVRDDFFELGGHSLLATQLVSRVREAFNVTLPLARLFETPTVEALARAIDEARASGLAGGAPIRRADLVERVGAPLSFSQQRLWFLQELDPASAAYNISGILALSGELRPEVLAAALAEIARRHEVLRTVFAMTGTGPVQVVLPPAPRQPALVDLGGLPEARREAEMAALAGGEARRPFDLATGPLMRETLVRLAPAEHRLIVVLHHIVSDAWSLGVTLDELAAHYRALLEGGPAALPALRIQYSDYAGAQRRELSGASLERLMAWWRGQLAGVPVLEVPTDHPRPPSLSDRGAALPVSFPPELVRALRGVCRAEGVTLFMILLGAFAVLLRRYTGQNDFAVGSPIANRDRRELEPLIGCFVNTLALRVRLDGDPGFHELLGRVRRTTLGAYEHQGMPFEKLVEELAPGRDRAHTPLFQVALALQNGPQAPLRLPGLTLSMSEVSTRTAKFDLALNLAEGSGKTGLTGALEYRTDLFEEATVDPPGRASGRAAAGHRPRSPAAPLRAAAADRGGEGAARRLEPCQGPAAAAGPCRRAGAGAGPQHAGRPRRRGRGDHADLRRAGRAGGAPGRTPARAGRGAGVAGGSPPDALGRAAGRAARGAADGRGVSAARSGVSGGAVEICGGGCAGLSPDRPHPRPLSQGRGERGDGGRFLH